MEDHTRLEPTAALVMLWSRELYQTGSAARFYSHLDLSNGERLREACNRACPWYRQVTLNRKWWLRHRAGDFIRKAGSPCQVILPAAGKSPLALELLDDCNDTIRSVIEIDIHGMDEKACLYREAAPGHSAKIRCVTSDLFDLEGTAGVIRDTGMYDPDLPTCVIPEGISYYIPPSLLSALIAPFTSGDERNYLLFDYLLPCRLVNDDQRVFPREVWRIINRDCNQSGTTVYSPDELGEILARAGCSRVLHHPMHDIERQRTGRNTYFPKKADGWIQVAEGWL